MADFKAEMHQIRFPLGLCPDRAGELTDLPRPPSCILKGLTSKGSEVGRKRGGEGENKREREGKGREWKGKRGERRYAPHVANSWLRHCYQAPNITLRCSRAYSQLGGISFHVHYNKS